MKTTKVAAKIPLIPLITLLVAMCVPLGFLIVSLLGSTWEYPDLLPALRESEALSTQILSALSKAALPVLSSFAYATGTVLLTILITILPARYLARGPRGKAFWETLFLLPAVVSPFTFLMGIQFILLKLGMGNSYGGVMAILTIVSYPYMLRALTAGYERLPQDMLACSRNLGASARHTLLKVELPLLIPSVIAGANIVFLVAFSDYFLVFVMGGARIKSLALLVFPLLTSSSRQVVSLYNLLFLIVPLFLFATVDNLVLTYYKKRQMESS